MSDVNSIADAELIRRVIANCAVRPRARNARTVPLWCKVSDAFSLGSTYAHQLCRKFGHDPEMMVRP